MRKPFFIIMNILICVLLILVSCNPPEGPNCHKRVVVVNHTGEHVYVSGTWGYSYISRESPIPQEGPENHRINPGESNNTAIYNPEVCLEKELRDDTLRIYVYPGNIIDNHFASGDRWPLDKLYSDELFFTLEELQAMDYTFDYYGPSEYSITVTSRPDYGGSVQATVNGIVVDKAHKLDTVTITALPYAGYSFARWNTNNSNATSKDNIATAIMPGKDIWVEAVFEEELPD